MTFATSGFTVLPVTPSNPDAVKKAAEIIAAFAKTDRNLAQEALVEITKEDPQLAEELQAAMYDFSDLALLTDKEMQLLLTQIDRGLLVRALRLTHKAVQQKILGNLSSRVRQEVIEESQARGKIPLSKVKAAQKEIVQVALKLEKEERIQFTTAGQDPTV